jgi:hypothetical protein
VREVNEALELMTEFGQNLGPDPVVGPSAAGFAVAYAGVDECLEVMADRGLGEA